MSKKFIRNTIVFTFLGVMILICGIMIWKRSFYGSQSGSEKNLDIEIVNCSDNLSVDELKDLLKGQGDLTIPKGESQCLLGFGGAIDLHGIQVLFREKDQTEIEIMNTDQSAVKEFDRLDCGEMAGVTSAYLRLVFKSKECNMAVKMNITGSVLAEDYLREENEIILEGNNPENPLYPYRIPVKQCMYTLAENILKKEAGNLSIHEKIVCFMDYISEFKIGMVGTYTSEEYLQKLVLNRIGACGDYSNLLAVLCATQNIETRLITLGNYPEGSGHAVMEVFTGGRWCVYDPTYALYYTTTPKNTKTPYVLSFEELKKGKTKNAVRVIGNEKHITGEYAFQYMGPEIYELAMPSGIVSPFNKLCYPMKYAYQENDEIQIGTYQGANYLGAADINNSHLWQISGLNAGELYQFKVVSNGIGGEYFEPMKTYASIEDGIIQSGAVKKWNGNEQEEWDILFIPNRSTIALKLDHKETGEQLHYLSLKAVQITQVKQEQN